MITQIKLNGIATFKQETIINPLKINFCYGSNGSGKTTISKALYDSYATGVTVSWQQDPIPTVVFNKEFIDKLFGETSKIKGIYTFGDDNQEAIQIIEDNKLKIESLKPLIVSNEISIEQLLSKQKELSSDLQRSCWAIQTKYKDIFTEALAGYRGSASDFTKKCLKEFDLLNDSPQPDIDALKTLYKTAFDKTQSIHNTYELIDMLQLNKNEQCNLLSQKIVGSAETPIGKFVEYLGNSDWLKNGLHYLDKSNNKCPFCTQELSSDIKEDIQSFFDASYKHDCESIKTFLSNYSSYTLQIKTQLEAIIDNKIGILDYSQLDAELSTFILQTEANINIINRKIAAPSQEVHIVSLSPIVERINKIILDFNIAIKRNNDIVNNQKASQINCKKQVWQLIIHELLVELNHYKTKLSGINDGLCNLNRIKKELSDKKNALECLITAKESSLTSVKPTLNDINDILKRFGFDGFHMIENTSMSGTYQIVRCDDGKCVEKTLSEGEYNFVAFLYFYHLVYGSHNNAGLSQDKIIVIDDPISSLDSNVLFIVSTLVKQIILDCKNSNNNLHQIFILTHNLYFHKEISFPGSRINWSPKDVAFWIIKKKANQSQVISYGAENPIQTSYELLWSELKNIENNSKATIFNTLRRILEYYFNVIGGMDYEKCIHEFEGNDLLMCKSLISCVNDGSHFINDDFVIQHETESIEQYLRIFETIFDKMGHRAHYDMMMRQSNK